MTADEKLPGSRRGRRNDPDRRDRIIEACLEVIADKGVNGTSHRSVARAAGVPLGSMTYYFTGMDDLLQAAFSCFAARFAESFEKHLTAATDLRSATDAVLAIILDNDSRRASRALVISYELYTLAAREPAYRALTSEWMRRSRAALELHFDPTTARMLDALIEGLILHRALDTDEGDPAVVVQAVGRIVGLPE